MQNFLMIPHLVHIFTTGLQKFMWAHICHLSIAAVDIIYMHLRSLLVICFGPFLALTPWTENSFFTLSVCVCVCVCVCVREKDFCYMACNCKRQKSPVCLYVLAFDGRSVRPPKKSQHLLLSLLASENLQLHLTSCGLLLGYSSQSLSFGSSNTRQLCKLPFFYFVLLWGRKIWMLDKFRNNKLINKRRF
jgi:hypothetical protein